MVVLYVEGWHQEVSLHSGVGVEICILSLSRGSIMSVLEHAFTDKILIIMYPRSAFHKQHSLLIKYNQLINLFKFVFTLPISSHIVHRIS